MIALGAALSACAADTGTEQPAPQPAAASATTKQPIVNGTADTTQPAAVFVYSETGGCTGALFKVDRARDLAWVLTAAHCVLDANGNNLVTPQGIVITTDYATDENSIFIEAVRAQYDTRYDGSDRYDFGVVTLHGIPSDDVLPALLPLTSSPDGLSEGQTVTSYGFGVTNAAGTAANSRRNKLTKTIYDLDSTDIVYAQQSSGICYGDSGGPVVSAAGKVVGVHSRVGQSGTGPCNGTGISARLTAGLAFVNGVVSSDQASPPAAIDACDRCVRNADYGNTVCRQKRDRCSDDSDCGALLNCLGEARSEPAQTACLNAHPESQGMAFDYFACACNDLCTSECSTDTTCQGWAEQKCGSIGFGSLKSCVESNCCAEMDAAAADRKATACLVSENEPGCDDSDLYVAAITCLEDKCGAASSSSSSGGSSGGSSSGNEGEGEGEGDDDAADDESGGTKKKKKKAADAGGCTVAAPGTAPAGMPAGAGVLLGLGLILARRKRAA